MIDLAIKLNETLIGMNVSLLTRLFYMTIVQIRSFWKRHFHEEEKPARCDSSKLCALRGKNWTAACLDCAQVRSFLVVLLLGWLFTPRFALADSAADRFWPQWRGPLATGVAPQADPPILGDEHD